MLPLLPSSFLILLLLLTQITTATPADAVKTITVSAAPTPTSPSYLSDTTFQNTILAAHNFYRAQHAAGALTYNSTLAKFAADYAKDCKFKHSGGPYGENLAAGYANVTAAVDGWGGERRKYNWKKPGFSEGTGHFTQLVWSNTTSVGCGRVACDGDNDTPGYYIVCEYAPQGNVNGEKNQFYKDNVKQQVSGKSTDTVPKTLGENGTVVADVPTSTSSAAAARKTIWSAGVVGAVGLGLLAV
ncbi:CAP domain-containing protein [Bisporella sp. PMI_857]|nr:CAP domain-containing protein [Bisporella sp. PMI_857]